MCVNSKRFRIWLKKQVKLPNSEPKADDKALPVKEVCAMVKNDTVNTKQKMKKKKNEDVNLVQKSTKILDTAEIVKTCKS